MTNNYYLYWHIRGDNQKVFYVGTGTKFQSEKDYSRAFDFRQSKRNPFWWNIFMKTGKEITVKIVEEFSCKKECLEREKYWIKIFGKYKEEGSLTNITDGGENTDAAKKIKQFTLDGKPIITWKSAIEASRNLNIKIILIYAAAYSKNGIKQAGGFLWKWDIDSTIVEPYINNRLSPIQQLSKDNIEIARYSSVSQASSLTKIDKGSISNTALGKRKSAGGYIWKYI